MSVEDCFARMSRRGMLQYVSILCSVIFVIFITCNLRFPFVLFSRHSSNFPLTRGAPKNTAILNVVDTSNFKNAYSASGIPCVNASIRASTFPLCVYNATDDVWVSKSFISGTYWESNSVKFLMDCLSVDQTLVFIDLGANIGGYTLAMAHMKRRVVAIEPNPATLLRLAKSISMGNVSEYITLLGNAVSDQHVTIRMRQDSTNRGDTSLLKQNNCTGADGSDCLSTSVQTITLDDLIPLVKSGRAIIKADIQGNEISAFSAKGASKFFQEIHVPIIYLEFHQYLRLYGNAEKKKEIDDWLMFWKVQGYTAHHYETRVKLGVDWNHWPYDVAFIKMN